MNDRALARISADAYSADPTYAAGDVRALRVSNVIAFRGTVPSVMADWLRDFDAIPVNDPDIGWAHQGFLDGACMMLPSIRPVAATVPLTLTGHSLGGALALALAALLVDRGCSVVSVVTFGAPHAVGAKARAILAGSSAQVRQYRNGLDIVPCVPWEPGMLAHVAPLTHIGRPSGNPLDDHAIARYGAALEAA